MARIGPLLLPLLLLSSHSVCGRSEQLSLTPVELAPVPCNDKAVGKLSRLAMTYINEDRPDGYKFALNRVANVHLHAQVSAAAPTARERSPLLGVILSFLRLANVLLRTQLLNPGADVCWFVWGQLSTHPQLLPQER